MSIRAALTRFRELHEQYRRGECKSPEELKAYAAERDTFLDALVRAQQLTLRPGQAPRLALRIARAERLVVVLGPRREGTLTVDLGIGGFAALVGPLAAHIMCDFELGTPPDSVRGKARVVASQRLADGSCRTSFQIMSMADEDRRRLEITVVDAALESAPR